MALIKKLVHKPEVQFSFRTEVECGYVVRELGDKSILHLETYGSKDREIPDKVSQSLELDEVIATQLVEVLRRTFPAID